MIHFTCDICGKEMHASDKDRYVLRVELRPVSEGELSEEDLSEDNLQKISKILQEEEATGQEAYTESSPVHVRYDLCPTCRDKYLKNPFSCQAVPNFDFSEN